MRIASVAGRAVVVRDDGFVDVALASEGTLPSETTALVAQLDRLAAWYRPDMDLTETIGATELARDGRLGPVVASPSQVFAIGLNYRTHALEMGLMTPPKPMVFTKFPSCLTHATASFPLPSDEVDWEAELVVVIGSGGRDLTVEQAPGAIAGYCVGQDISNRALQLLGSPAQFSLGKSHRNFAPVGPWITTADEVPDPNDLRIQCRVNDTVYQDASTSDMIFTVFQIVSYLSSVCALRPGDLIFTGSPAGVGQGHRPPIFLRSGDVLTTTIERLGGLRNVAE